MLIQILTLFLGVHRAWPAYPVEKALALAVRSVEVGDAIGMPPSLLAAVAQHESDLEPGAVSWVTNGVRHDFVFDVHLSPTAQPAPAAHLEGDTLVVLIPPDPIALWKHPATCGYLQAMARDGFDCVDMIQADGGMLRGALEIAEWLRTCRGDLRCALAGHAGGNAGMRAAREHRDTQATRFADLFLERARVLAWR